MNNCMTYIYIYIYIYIHIYIYIYSAQLIYTEIYSLQAPSSYINNRVSDNRLFPRDSSFFSLLREALRFTMKVTCLGGLYKIIILFWRRHKGRQRVLRVINFVQLVFSCISM